MQTVYDREVTLHSRNAQGRNALTERAGRAAVFYKPAYARKTQPGAWRRLAAVALCCGALLCAFRLYGRARSRFGVQLPVRTVLQNPELPNGCEAASLAALLKYKGVPADKLDLAYGYIPRGDIEETTDGRTGPDPELAYAGDPAAGLGFYCFAQPVAQGANAYLAAQGSALRAADITGVTGQGLLQYLRGGDPVIVWITKDLSAPRTGGCTWLLADTGETCTPYVNLRLRRACGVGRGYLHHRRPAAGQAQSGCGCVSAMLQANGQPRRRGALTKAGKRGARRSLCGRKRLCGMTALAPAHAKRLAALCGPASDFFAPKHLRFFVCS